MFNFLKCKKSEKVNGISKDVYELCQSALKTADEHRAIRESADLRLQKLIGERKAMEFINKVKNK